LRILKKAAKALFLPLGFLNSCIPKNPYSMFFYSNLGFRDNVKSLYDYVISKGLNSRFKITVATDEYKAFRKNAPKNVRFVGTAQGIFSFLRSKNCFYSFGKYPIKPKRDQIVVNLWHGMPLKSVGRLEKGHQNDDQNFFTHIIATSPFFADILCRAFGAQQEQVLITSQPRCDVFYEDAAKPEFFSDYDKIIFWLPTFLSSKRLGQTDGFYEEVNPYDAHFLRQICPILEEKKILLVIKPHPMDDVVLPRQHFSNLLYLNDKDLSEKGVTIYELLKYSNALVTDFSSIYFDYLLLDRPIAFACPDTEEYRQKRGFVTEDISELMPGYHIYNADDFSSFVSAVANGEDPYSEKRRECNLCFNTFTSGGGSQRILNELRICKSEEK